MHLFALERGNASEVNEVDPKFGIPSTGVRKLLNIKFHNCGFINFLVEAVGRTDGRTRACACAKP